LTAAVSYPASKSKVRGSARTAPDEEFVYKRCKPANHRKGETRSKKIIEISAAGVVIKVSNFQEKTY